MRADLDPFIVPPFLTAPLPAYVSFASALSEHGMIEQIPKRIGVASLDRAREITTSVGTFSIHHLAPAVFGGFEGSADTGYIAGPEKALFDAVYVRVASGRRASFPELTLPPRFKEADLHMWISRIVGKRLRTLTERSLGEAVRHAYRDGL